MKPPFAVGEIVRERGKPGIFRVVRCKWVSETVPGVAPYWSCDIERGIGEWIETLSLPARFVERVVADERIAFAGEAVGAS